MIKRLLCVAALVAAAGLARADLGGVVLRPVASGLSNPLLLTHAGDGSGRRFIVEQTGRIKVMVGDEVLDEPFLDVGPTGLNRITSVGFEQGLLGLAFHPGFPATPYLYIAYTKPDRNAIVARFAVDAGDPNRADTTSEENILGPIFQPQDTHNVGCLAFGPDGYLYIGAGDGGGFADNNPGHTEGIGNAQDLTKLLGKILRIDVDVEEDDARGGDEPLYAIPPENPFADSPPNAPEIYAWGLRNPWRFSFDRATGRLFCGDVGQRTWEEINLIERGGNYGWRCYEGNAAFNAVNCTMQSDYDFPLAVFNHTSTQPGEPARCAIVGGYVYRGLLSPDLDGYYFYGDFCSGDIFALEGVAPETWVSHFVTRYDGMISSFGEDEAGEIYVISRDTGAVLQIVSPFADSSAVSLR